MLDRRGRRPEAFPAFAPAACFRGLSATPVSHDLKLDRPEGEKPLKACEQDGETLEVQFLGGPPRISTNFPFRPLG